MFFWNVLLLHKWVKVDESQDGQPLGVSLDRHNQDGLITCSMHSLRIQRHLNRGTFLNEDIVEDMSFFISMLIING